VRNFFVTPFLRPTYGRGCFADLPPLIRSWLTGRTEMAVEELIPTAFQRRYDRVVFVLVDGFGWRFFQRFAEQPLLRRFTDQGSVLRWTSQFPSTTAAHVTCVNTGLTPGQSGIFEWQYYEPTLDSVIEPLTFSYAGEDERELLRQQGIHPSALLPPQTFYQALQADGVASYVYQPREFYRSSYSEWMLRGAAVRGYRTLPEGLADLRQEVMRVERPAYFHLYFGMVDHIGHYRGLDTPQMDAEIDSCLYNLERTLVEPLAGRMENTLLILTADHGMVEVSPQRTIYLNTDKRFRGLERFLRLDRQGRILPPGGSARDPFLYIHEEQLDEAHAFLSERLAGVAEVHKSQGLIEGGYFGPLPLAPEFLARVGNLVILPYAGECVWWYERDRFEQRFYGHHGGLTPQEMEIGVGLLSLAFG
jgi:hypothetical protein